MSNQWSLGYPLSDKQVNIIVYMYIYTHTHMHVCMCVYIYILAIQICSCFLIQGVHGAGAATWLRLDPRSSIPGGRMVSVHH